MKKKKYLKWWIAAVSAVFIVGAGIFVYTQYKAAQTSGDVATKDGTSASASDITWNGKTCGGSCRDVRQRLFRGAVGRDKTSDRKFLCEEESNCGKRI